MGTDDWLLVTKENRCFDTPNQTCPVVIEQCYFNSTPEPFNGQTANIISKPPKVIESISYV